MRGGGVLLDKFVAGMRNPGNAIAVRIYFWGYESVRQAQVGCRGRGRGRRVTRRRSISAAAIAIWDFTFDGVPRLGHVFAVLILRVRVHIEDSKTDASFCKISANGHLDSKQTVVSQRVCACYYGEHVDAGRQPPDCVYFRSGEGWTIEEGIGGYGGLEDDGVRLGV